jgi:hypothetical protein
MEEFESGADNERTSNGVYLQQPRRRSRGNDIEVAVKVSALCFYHVNVCESFIFRL